MSLFEIFLLELAKVLQFPSLSPDAHGACLIIMKEGKIPLLFEFDEQLVPNTVLLSCALSPISIIHRIDIYEALLIGNSSQEDTLSIKPDEDMLYLHRRFHPDIQSIDLEPLLHQFLETAKEWKNRVEVISKNPPRAHPSHPSSIQVFPYKV